MRAYVETPKGKVPLSEFDILVIELEGGEIRIQLGEDRGKEDSVLVSCMGEGLPALLVIPGGGMNSVRLRIDDR